MDSIFYSYILKMCDFCCYYSFVFNLKLTKQTKIDNIILHICIFGASPSGKAAVFGTAIRRFESSRPRLKNKVLYNIIYYDIINLYNLYFFSNLSVKKNKGSMPEWLKGADCKSVSYAYVGSNPTRPQIQKFPPF